MGLTPATTCEEVVTMSRVLGRPASPWLMPLLGSRTSPAALIIPASLSACSSLGPADASDGSSTLVECPSSQHGCTSDAGTSSDGATVGDSAAVTGDAAT